MIFHFVTREVLSLYSSFPLLFPFSPSSASSASPFTYMARRSIGAAAGYLTALNLSENMNNDPWFGVPLLARYLLIPGHNYAPLILTCISTPCYLSLPFFLIEIIQSSWPDATISLRFIKHSFRTGEYRFTWDRLHMCLLSRSETAGHIEDINICRPYWKI